MQREAPPTSAGKEVVQRETRPTRLPTVRGPALTTDGKAVLRRAPPTPELGRNPSPVRAASRCHYITTRCTRLFCLRSSCCTFGVLLCSLQHGCALRHFPLISTLTSPEGRGFTALQGPRKEIAATWKPGIQT